MANPEHTARLHDAFTRPYQPRLPGIFPTDHPSLPLIPDKIQKAYVQKSLFILPNTDEQILHRSSQKTQYDYERELPDPLLNPHNIRHNRQKTRKSHDLRSYAEKIRYKVIFTPDPSAFFELNNSPVAESRDPFTTGFENPSHVLYRDEVGIKQEISLTHTFSQTQLISYIDDPGQKHPLFTIERQNRSPDIRNDVPPIPSLDMFEPPETDGLKDYFSPHSEEFPNYCYMPVEDLETALQDLERKYGKNIWVDGKKAKIQYYVTDFEFLYRFMLGKLGLPVPDAHDYQEDPELTAITTGNALHFFDAILSSVKEIYQGRDFTSVFPTLGALKLGTYKEIAESFISNPPPEICSADELTTLLWGIWNDIQWNPSFIPSKTIPVSKDLGIPDREQITYAFMKNDEVVNKVHCMIEAWVYGLTGNNPQSMEFDPDVFVARELSLVNIDKLSGVLMSARVDAACYKHIHIKRNKYPTTILQIFDLKTGSLNNLTQFTGEIMRRQAEAMLFLGQQFVKQQFHQERTDDAQESSNISHAMTQLAHTGEGYRAFRDENTDTYPSQVGFAYKSYWNSTAGAPWIYYTGVRTNHESWDEGLRWRSVLDRTLWQFEGEARDLINRNHRIAKQ